jgi:hypothetical protein
MLDQDEFLLDLDDASRDTDSDRRLLCVASCSICAQACMSFAETTPVRDEEAEMARATRLAEDCADVCSTTWRLLVRGSDQELDVVRALVEACAAAARACRRECERYTTESRVSASCAAACWVCEEACDDLASKLAS